MRRPILISQGGIPQVERGDGSEAHELQAAAGLHGLLLFSLSLSLSRGAEHCPSTWAGVQTRILIIIYGKPAQRHALEKGDGERRAARWRERYNEGGEAVR